MSNMCHEARLIIVNLHSRADGVKEVWKNVNGQENEGGMGTEMLDWLGYNIKR